MKFETSSFKEQEETLEKSISKEQLKAKRYTILAFSFIIIGAGAFIYWFISGNNNDLDKFGDYVGGVVTSIWSLAGLIIIYVAFLGQKQQILQQQKEMLYNRFEISMTREEMVQQNETLSRQRFENTFFQMLSLHHQIVDSIEYIHPNRTRTGRDAFKFIYEQFHSEMQSKRKDDFNITLETYLKHYKRSQHLLGHYFRNLYHIIKLVKYSDIEEKSRYTSLVRAQLSSHELLMLFYNCLTINGLEKFKPLVEEFRLFKNMPTEEIVYPLDKDQYSNTAYFKVE